MESGFPSSFLKLIHNRMVTYYPGQVRACLDALSDQDLWWRPGPQTNSVGTLVVHLCGSLRHFVGYKIGGIAYVRDREAEFVPDAGLTQSDLRQQFEATVRILDQVLSGLSVADLAKPGPGAAANDTVGEGLVRHAEHFALHAGQIIWITKSLKQGVFHELWQRPG